MKFKSVLLICIFSACAVHKKMDSFIPSEYNFPDVKIGERKTFVYIDRGNGDTSFNDFYHYEKNGRIYFMGTSYKKDTLSDSLIYLEGKLSEQFSCMFSKIVPTKATIVQDTVINNGKKFGQHILEENFNSDSIVDVLRAESEFIKDTVFAWQNTLIPTLVIKTTLYATFKSKVNPNIHTDFQLPYLTYQAKNIGTIRTTILKTVDNKTKNIDLVEIRKLSPRK